jgi:hypothetical protein
MVPLLNWSVFIVEPEDGTAGVLGVYGVLPSVLDLEDGGSVVGCCSSL